MTYSVFCPNFDPASGGIKVTWGLLGHLLTKGQTALPNLQDADVVIYPEIISGNPLNGKRVIRYILQKPGMMSYYGVPGPTQFDPLDELYVFSKVYDEWNSPDDHILFLPIIDLHNFKDLKKKRNKVGFYVGKGVNLYQHPKGAVEIKRNGDQRQLAEQLNELKTLYVYDHLSAIMECARLSGCAVVYLGDMPEEQLKLYEPGLNGLGYKKEEKLDILTFREHYKKMIRDFELKLDYFIERSQK